MRGGCRCLRARPGAVTGQKACIEVKQVVDGDTAEAEDVVPATCVTRQNCRRQAALSLQKRLQIKSKRILSRKTHGSSGARCYLDTLTVSYLHTSKGSEMGVRSQRLTNWLATCPRPVFVGYAAFAAFSTYFCMYAFRKPFAAASFDGQQFLGGEIALKTAFVVSQILGYTVSKYIGIKVCPEIRPGRRAAMVVLLVLCAEAALVLFAVLPADLKVVAIFCNGLPLGMVWGLVVLYLEGRLVSELLLAGLACSYIVSSGAVKDVGRYLMAAHSVSEAAMPMLTGLVFLPLLVVSVWLLNHLPPPNAADQLRRVRRSTMDGSERLAFFKALLLGLLLLIAVRVLTTAFRDYRDNYGVELFSALGCHGDATLFTRTEIPVALGVMIALALFSLIRDNQRSVAGAHLLMLSGMALMVIATLLLDAGALGGIGWMILVGLGSYMTYVPLDSVVFDRIIASTRVPGTAVFAIYLADAIGYTGSIGLPLVKDLLFPNVDRLAFFRLCTYIVSVGGSVILVMSGLYFYRKHQQPTKAEMDCDDPVDFVITLLEQKGGATYLGEQVSQTAHALQAAWAAEQAGAAGVMIAAALLHDVGHVLHDLPEAGALDDRHDAHEERGAGWLARHFGPDVVEPVRLHVAAKRFLCATDPAYRRLLSEASLRSLELQGGPFAADEAAAFARGPYAEAAVALRRFDEQAKIPGLSTPDLEHFRPVLEKARAARPV
jgi:phosphonate degradation associated HDIG domain protein